MKNNFSLNRIISRRKLINYKTNYKMKKRDNNNNNNNVKNIKKKFNN